MTDEKRHLTELADLIAVVPAVGAVVVERGTRKRYVVLRYDTDRTVELRTTPGHEVLRVPSRCDSFWARFAPPGDEVVAPRIPQSEEGGREVAEASAAEESPPPQPAEEPAPRIIVGSHDRAEVPLGSKLDQILEKLDRIERVQTALARHLGVVSYHPPHGHRPLREVAQELGLSREQLDRVKKDEG